MSRRKMTPREALLELAYVVAGMDPETLEGQRFRRVFVALKEQASANEYLVEEVSMNVREIGELREHLRRIEEAGRSECPLA